MGRRPDRRMNPDNSPEHRLAEASLLAVSIAHTDKAHRKARKSVSGVGPSPTAPVSHRSASISSFMMDGRKSTSLRIGAEFSNAIRKSCSLAHTPRKCGPARTDPGARPARRRPALRRPWTSSLCRSGLSPSRSVAGAEIGCEKLLDYALVRHAEIDRERRGKSVLFPGASRRGDWCTRRTRAAGRGCVSRPADCISATRRSRAPARLTGGRLRRDDLIRVAHRDHRRDVESGQTRRLEPHVGQHRDPRSLMTTSGAAGSWPVIASILANARRPLSGVERTFLLAGAVTVERRAAVAAQDRCVEIDGFARLPIADADCPGWRPPFRRGAGPAQRENPRERRCSGPAHAQHEQDDWPGLGLGAGGSLYIGGR